MMPNNNMLYLPPIYPNNPQVNQALERERYRVSKDAYNFINKRLARSESYNMPFKNYPLYPYDMSRFVGNYPQSLFYYRPIRYFFQRPVQMDYNNCFPHQKAQLKELMERDEKIRQSLNGKNVKYGIPRKMEDLIKKGEVVHYPTATVISAADLKKKQEEFNKLQEKIDKIGPEGQRRIRKRNAELRDKMRKIIYFNGFLLDLKEYSRTVKQRRENKFIHTQATKANINEIKTFMLKIMKNIEQFSTQFLGEKINLVSTDQKKKDDAAFVIKSFIHQLYNDLSSAFCKKEDLPDSIRDLFKTYIKEKSILPPFFLTTFEFNRLEFDVRLRLNMMTPERQALLVGFILFYRVLIIDIFKNYLTYFPRIREMGNPLGDLFDRDIKRTSVLGGPDMQRAGTRKSLYATPNRKKGSIVSNSSPARQRASIMNNLNSQDADAQILQIKKNKKVVQDNLAYNFNVMTQVLSHIVKTSFENHPPIYRDYFKDKNLYGKLVYSVKEDEKRNLLGDNFTDEIEITKGIIKPLVEVDAFLAENARWIHMYQLNTIQFCNEFAKMVLE